MASTISSTSRNYAPARPSWGDFGSPSSKTTTTDYHTMMWPNNLLSTYDYVQINVEEFNSVRDRKKLRSGNFYQNEGGYIAPIGGSALSSTWANKRWSDRASKTTQSKVVGTVMLPIPENLRVDDRPKWSDGEVGVLGRFAPELAKAIANDAGTGEITKQVANLAEVGKVGLIKDLIKNFGADPNAATQNLGRKIVNPYVEQVFGGIDLRSFDFNWKLVPRSRDEQRTIQQLIKFIRQAAMPNTSDKFGSGRGSNVVNESRAGYESTDRWLTVPNLFSIKWKVGKDEITSLPKLKKCVCRSVSVEYTPDNVWATHMGDDGPAPVAYNLTASFGETEIITSADIRDGGY